jgi:hypothetical protein
VPDRYLLVFDTSSSMKSRAKTVEDAAHALIVSGMYGQLRRGDTIGLWTFDDQLHTGLFPLQVWRPEERGKIAELVASFLANQKYKNKARFDAVMPALGQLVENSETITVLLFSDGETNIQGTPFDAEINSIYAEFRRRAKVLITVLRAKRGRLFAATANPAPWAVEFPPYPPEPQTTNAPPPKPAAEKPRPMAAPIILDMSKPRPPETNPVPSVSAGPAPTPPTNTTTPAAEVKPVEPPPTVPAPAQIPAALGPPPPAQGTPATNPVPQAAGGVSQAVPSAPQQGAQPPAATAPVQTPATAPAEKVIVGQGVLLAVCAFLTLALVTTVLLLVRQRMRQQDSPPTRPMERDR